VSARNFDQTGLDFSHMTSLSIALVGDIVLDVPDAAHWLSGIAPALRKADVAIGHLEVPHTLRGIELAGDVPAPAADPDNLIALKDAGIDMLSLAGNHISDCGPEGIADTISTLDALGIAHSGAGMTLAEARTPAFVTRNGRTIALLSYNCVGPENGWAGDTQAGCAWLRIETADGGPINPNASLDRLAPSVAEMLREDIAFARTKADLIIVSLHKGIVHTPATLAPYERALCHAAVDAGADVVVGHHAHILKGIETYLGKPIFHGLGNGCVVTKALNPDQDHPARRAWAEERKTRFGFEPDPAYNLAPFHPEAVNAMIGRLLWYEDGRIEAGIVPVHVEAPGRPILVNGESGREIADYVEKITVDAGMLPISLSARDDMMVLM
jgi:poly-gamma-glutamate capsule biosynthesis protein CapA/YwtB (metallophosphatase superfamily)